MEQIERSKDIESSATAVVHRSEDWLDDYAKRVYAGVLGKIIGVYLGRPVENWSYEKITESFGQIDYYIHEQRGRQLVITDDDISGTFTFLRALRDNGFDKNISAKKIGDTWLNYLIEKTTILWWGGLGNSTEHTAYIRLKQGYTAPESGSIKLNTKAVAEQIGSQIFIEGWGMVAPGDARLAASLASRAASVSHDGEAVYAAQVVATMASMAFVEPNIQRLIDVALSQIPSDCIIRTLIDDLRTWHVSEADWRANRERLQAEYGYHRFNGNVPVVPNHGLIILSLLHGEGDFHRSLSIVNTSGWDTDCNSGNVGCILGIRGGLEAIEDGPDWRGPVADRLYVPSAAPGRSVSDAVREAIEIINVRRAMNGKSEISPKSGARYHFSFTGSVQGFRALAGGDSCDGIKLHNDSGELVVDFARLARGTSCRVRTSTFIPPELKDIVTGYVLVASPTIYPGQIATARMRASNTNTQGIRVKLFVSHYNEHDLLTTVRSQSQLMEPGKVSDFSWQIPDVGGYPIAEFGIELTSGTRTDGSVTIEYVDWSGIPTVSFDPVAGTMWGRAWAKAMDRFEYAKDKSYEHLAHNDGTGLLIQGANEWQDYTFEATIVPQMMKRGGIAFRVQGLKRYYALVICDDNQLRLVRELDGTTVLAAASLEFDAFKEVPLKIMCEGDNIQAFANGEEVFSILDRSALTSGAIGLLCEEGCLGARKLSIRPN